MARHTLWLADELLRCAGVLYLRLSKKLIANRSIQPHKR
jgi:hypothetical protein